MAAGKRDWLSINKLSQAQRKRLLWTAVIIITLIIFVFWLTLFQVIVGPDEQDQANQTKLQAIQTSLSAFANNSKDNLDKIKHQLEQARNPQPAAPAEGLDPASLEALKAKLLAPTSDWLSYENTSYGFTFSYPPDWPLSTTTNELDRRFIAQLTSSEPALDNASLELSGSSDTTGLDACPMTFNGRPACRQSQATATTTTEQIDILNQPKKITIRVSYPTENQALFKKIFDTLLSTFTFSKPDQRL